MPVQPSVLLLSLVHLLSIDKTYQPQFKGIEWGRCFLHSSNLQACTIAACLANMGEKLTEMLRLALELSEVESLLRHKNHWWYCTADHSKIISYRGITVSFSHFLELREQKFSILFIEGHSFAEVGCGAFCCQAWNRYSKALMWPLWYCKMTQLASPNYATYRLQKH